MGVGFRGGGAKRAKLLFKKYAKWNLKKNTTHFKVFMKSFAYPCSKIKAKRLLYANNKGYEWVLVLGEEEQKEQSYSLKNMQSGILRKIQHTSKYL